MVGYRKVVEELNPKMPNILTEYGMSEDICLTSSHP